MYCKPLGKIAVTIVVTGDPEAGHTALVRLCAAILVSRSLVQAASATELPADEVVRQHDQASTHHHSHDNVPY